MFDYDANIRVNINDTAALAALKKLEDKIAQLSDPRTAGSLKSLVASSKAQLKAEQDFRALKQERAEDLAYRRRKARQIAYELRLNNALELQEGRRIKLQRAGALDVASRKKAVAKLDKIAAANPKNAEIQERVATGLSRILTTQNEINRATNKNIGQKQRIADYNKQIDRLRELGATEGQLRKAQKRKYEFIDAAERRQTSLSDRRELQLKREIKLLGDTQKAARDAATAVTRPGTLSGGARSPVGGSANTPGSPKYIDAQASAAAKAVKELDKIAAAEQKRNQAAGGARSPVSGAANIPGSPKYVEAQAAATAKAVKELDKIAAAEQKRNQAAGGARSPVSGAANIPGSPKYVEAQAAATAKAVKELDKIAAAEQRRKQAAGGARSAVRGSVDTPGSPKYLEAQAKALDKVAAAEQRRNQAAGGARSPLRGSADTPGSPKYLEAQAKAVEKLAKAGGPSSPLGKRSVLGSDESLRKKAEYYERVAKSVKAISSPMRAQSVLGSDSSLRKKAEYYERINRAIKGPASSLKDAPARTVLDSNSALKQKAAYYERIARRAKTTKTDTAATAKNIEKSAKSAKNLSTGLDKAGGKKGEGFLNFGKGQTNLAAGVGFPLLFGGGPGSVIGGGLGALAGGFGGSIIGGAIGTQLDKLGAAALSTAEAFEKLGSGASDLIPKLGRGAGEGFGGQAQFLIDEGSSSQVGEIIRKRFAEVYGEKALADFDKLAETNKKFKQTWQELGVQFQLLIDGPLKGLLDIINRINFNAKKDKELTPQELKVRKLEQRNRGFGPTINQAEIDELEAARAELAESQKAKVDPSNTGVTADTEAQKQLVDLVNQKKEIEKTINTEKLAALEQALTARRDDLALLNTAAGITRATADLDNTRKELAAERNAINKDTLKIAQLEKTEVEQAAELERQQVAQANALRKAQLQIYKDEENARISAFKVRGDIYQLELKKASLITTAANQAQNSLTAAREEASTQEQILRAQFELRKLDIKEQEVKIQEAILLETKVDKIKAELALKEKAIQQAEVLRQIGIDQYNQQQELNTLLAEQNALRAQQANDPSRTFSFDAQGFGFFGDSFKLEADLFQKYNDDIDVFNRKIADAKANLAKLTEADIKDGRAQPFLAQLDTLEVLKGNYERLQPAINAAALEQQRFNDALAAVSPGVNALVGGLQEVVAGTKTAEEAFADFLRTIADQLVQTAALMIAQYIAIGLAKAFAGLGTPVGGQTSLPGTSIGSGGGEFTNIAGNVFGTLGPNFGIRQRADGGPVSANQPYIVGERGPELLIPQTSGTVLSNADSKAALARYKPGNSLLSEAGGDSTGTGVGRSQTLDPVINISTGPTLQFEGEKYVKQEDFRAGLARAAQEGARQGQTLTLRKLMMSPTARSKIGI